MKWLHRVLCLAALVCPSSATAADTVVLDESAYCRSRARFRAERISPASLRDEKLKLLRQDLRRVKRDVERTAGMWGVKVTDENWREHYYPEIQWLQYGGTRRWANPFIESPTPPENWTAPDFDDTRWLLQRQPIMVGPNGLGPGGNFYRKAVYTRYRFDVSEPAKAGRMTLNLVYHGGVRVFLNGKEIGRGHLPEGKLDANTPGGDYPAGAYVRIGEGGQIFVVKDWKGRSSRDAYIFIPQCNGEFDNHPPALDRKRRPIPGAVRLGRITVTRRDWDHAKKVRDRKLVAEIPANLLKKGTNVLAVEVRASDLHRIAIASGRNFRTPHAGDVAWSHGQLISMKLSATGDVQRAAKAAPGVWVEDMHRILISAEYKPANVPSSPLRFVGTANGSFSGQIVVRTGDKAVNGLKFTPSGLTTEDGAVMPASVLTMRAMEGKPLNEWALLGFGRGGFQSCQNPFASGGAILALNRFGPAGVTKLPRERKVEEMKKLFFFDHITDSPQKPVPANTCRPSWVTLKVPANVKPGIYKGSIKVEGAGMTPVTLPVVAEIHAWRIPAPYDFQANAAIEQSAYGVARQYKTPLWSDAHFKQMDGSFKALGLIGNDWINVPVINYTEFGNMTDSMIRWVRKADGTMTWDYTVLDKYLALARKHLGKPKVINFIVMHGAGGYEADVQVKDEKTGKTETLKMGGDRPWYAETWKAFACDLRMHMRSLGLEESMWWGYMWDSTADSELLGVMKSVTPNVWWTKGAHRGKELYEVRAFSQLLPFRLRGSSNRGWKNPWFHVANPRGGGSLMCGSGTAFPFNFRLGIDRSLCVGMNGIGRIGADYFGDTYMRGVKATGWLRAGMPHHHILWPGPKYVEPSVRFMAMREGYQETEARIYLEQLVDRKAVPEALAKRITDTLNRHHRETLAVPSMGAGWQHAEMMRDWQDRSSRLFKIAAEATAAVPVDISTFKIAREVPARGKVTAPFVVRGWTSEPRAWKIATDQPWIVPAKTAGTSRGHESVPVTLDAAKLKPNETAKGSFTVTDVKSGKSETVEVTANVSKVLHYVYSTEGLNRREFRFVPDNGKVQISTTVGGETTKTLYFFNKSATEVAWKTKTSLPWLKVTPSAGKAGAGHMVTVRLTSTPAAKDEGGHDATITISEANGPEEEVVKVITYALKPYAPPASMPGGKVVLVDGKLHKALLKSRAERKAQWCGHEILYVATCKPGHKERGVPVQTYLTMPGPARTVYKIEGKGFKAFSAKVDLPLSSGGYKYWAGCSGAKFEDWTAARFEIYVDGALKAYSGWIGKKSGLQTLVVSGLENAKTLSLVTRFQRRNACAVTVGWWDARFYK